MKLISSRNSNRNFALLEGPLNSLKRFEYSTVLVTNTIKDLRRIIGEWLFMPTAISWIDRMSWFLPKNCTLLDLGCGTCMITKILKKDGHQVTTVDIANLSYYPDITPVIYDGVHLPYANNTFDVCILLAVLHHATSPLETLKEAVRVSKKLIILEDLIVNRIQSKYTYFLDRIINKEFLSPPHHNKSDKEWQNIFSEIGLKLVKTEYSQAYFFIKNATYYLEKSL